MKCIHVKHWFFKEHIDEGSGIVLLKIATEDQLADMFTKGMCKQLHIPLRNELMGWSQWTSCDGARLSRANVVQSAFDNLPDGAVLDVHERPSDERVCVEKKCF